MCVCEGVREREREGERERERDRETDRVRKKKLPGFILSLEGTVRRF